jgi:hypothetical protein
MDPYVPGIRSLPQAHIVNASGISHLISSHSPVDRLLGLQKLKENDKKLRFPYIMFSCYYEKLKS